MTAAEIFAHALRTFALFTLDEQRATLERFAQLKEPTIDDRFAEAVSHTIQEIARVPHQ